MENEKITPDKKLNKLLSSCISKSFSEYGRNRKRPFSEVNHDETDLPAVDKGKKRHIDSQDEDAYFDRVETYDLMSWFAKPVELSPLVCSRYGWKITEPDMLRCVGCKEVLCGQLPKRADSLIYHESCRKLKDSVKLAHLKSCFWPAYPSPEHFSSIPLKDKRKLTTLLISHIENLQGLQDQLPLVSYRSIEDKGMSANQLEEIKCIVEKHLDNQDLDNMELSTFCLGVTGWNVVDPNTVLLSCHYCRRKVGLWNYKTKNSHHAEEQDSSDESESESESMSCQTEVTPGKKEACITPLDNQGNIHESLLTKERTSDLLANVPEKASNSLSKVFEKITDSVGKVFEKITDSVGKVFENTTDSVAEVEESESNSYSKVNGSSSDSLAKVETSPVIQSKVNGSSSDSLALVETSPMKQFDFSQPCDVESLSNSENSNLSKENISTFENDHAAKETFSFSQPSVIESCDISKNNENIDPQCNSVTQNGNEHVEKSPNRSAVEDNINHVVEEPGECSNGNKDLVHTDCDLSEDVTKVELPVDTVQTYSKPKRKKIKVVKKDSFDPLEEHRYWCPWINRVPDSISHSPKKISEISQLGDKKTVYPWELALQILSRSFLDVSFEDSVSEHFKHHSPVEGMRQLRNLMKDWSN